MPRVVLMHVVLVSLLGVPVAVSAPVPKELKSAPTRFVLRFGGPSLDPKKMDWGLDLVVEWERTKDKPGGDQAGVRITKWRAVSPFAACDEATLRANGKVDGKAVQLKATAENLLVLTRQRELATAWEANSSFGFSQQPGDPGPVPPTVKGLYRLTATVELFASKTKQFDFTLPDGPNGALTAAGGTTSQLSGNLTIFLAESPTDGLIHTTVHGGFGGASLATNPNALRLPAKGRVEQGTPKDAPHKAGNGYEFEWRMEYTGGSK